MAIPPLTIRNLTPIPITLIDVARFQDPNTQQSKPSVFPFSIGAKNKTSAAPAAPQLGEHAQTFSHEELNVTLAPFSSSTLKTNKTTPNRQDGSPIIASTTLRLTLQTKNGDRYRIDTNPSYTQKSTKPLLSLTPTPTHKYTTIFHPSKLSEAPHLTIHLAPIPSPSQWMTILPPTLPLSLLSIPGTHNSHTCYRALPSVRCQQHPVLTQLRHGIRFLDIRVQPAHPTDITSRSKDLYLVHGAFPVALVGTKTFAPVLAEVYHFLEECPGETVILSLKREGVGSATDDQLSKVLEEHIFSKRREMWWYLPSYEEVSPEPRIPYLGDVRGKIVLLRRYDSSPNPSVERRPRLPGLPATPWPHSTPNAPFNPSSSRIPFSLQDFCDIHAPTAIAQKLVYATDHITRSFSSASSGPHHIPGFNTDVTNPVPPGPMYLNFLSGSNFWRVGCWPGAIAGVVNRGVEEWVCRALASTGSGGEGDEGNVKAVDVYKKEAMGQDFGLGCTGVVIMDHVGEGGDWDLVNLIIGLNTFVVAKIQDDGNYGRADV